MVSVASLAQTFLWFEASRLVHCHASEHSMGHCRKLHFRGLLANVLTYSAAISACEKGQNPLLTGAESVAGVAAQRPPAHRDHLQRGHQRMRERPKATTGAAYVAGVAAQRPPAHRDHLQRGHQRMRERPKATTGVAYVAEVAAQRPPAHRDHRRRGHQRRREGSKVTACAAYVSRSCSSEASCAP